MPGPNRTPRAITTRLQAQMPVIPLTVPPPKSTVATGPARRASHTPPDSLVKARPRTAFPFRSPRPPVNTHTPVVSRPHLTTGASQNPSKHDTRFSGLRSRKRWNWHSQRSVLDMAAYSLGRG